MPASPVPGETLRCEITRAASDADGDPLSYAYAWYEDGILQSFAPTSTEVPGRLVRAGKKWSCAVTASDGQTATPSPESLAATAAP